MLEIDVTTDIKKATKYLNKLQRKDIPFATSLALNDTAFDARGSAQKGMDAAFESVTAFTKRGVQVKKASKRKLKSTVFIEEKRLRYLERQLKGGTRLPTRKYIAIAKGLQTQRGTPRKKNLSSRQIQSILAKKNTFTDTINVGGKSVTGIWHRVKQGKNKGIRLLVQYVPVAEYDASYDFEEIVIKVVDRRFLKHFQKRFRAVQLRGSR